MVEDLRARSVITAFAFLLAAGSIGAVLGPSGGFASRLSNSASMVTIFGAILAVVIWAWSRRESAHHSAHLEKVEGDILTVSDVVGEMSGADGMPPAPAQRTAPRQTVRFQGVELECIEPEAIPLRVFGDLIAYWRADPNGAGRWMLRDLEWTARRPGKGNPPWLVKFHPDPEHVYRIAYGGKGKREVGTVTRHPTIHLDGWCA